MDPARQTLRQLAAAESPLARMRMRVTSANTGTRTQYNGRLASTCACHRRPLYPDPAADPGSTPGTGFMAKLGSIGNAGSAMSAAFTNVLAT